MPMPWLTPSTSPGLNGAKQSIDMDCDGRLWVTSDNSMFHTEVIEAGVCDWMDIPWLSLGNNTGTVANGATQDIALTFDPAGLGIRNLHRLYLN